MAKTNITGHGQDYCGTPYCKGELCHGKIKQPKYKRSPYESDLMAQAVSVPTFESKVSPKLEVKGLKSPISNEQAKDKLADLFERNEVADILKNLPSKDKNDLIADGEMKDRLREVAEAINVQSKDLADLYMALSEEQEDGDGPIRITEVKKVPVNNKEITLITLDDGTTVYHSSQKELEDFQILKNNIDDGIAAEMNEHEFWDKTYYQSNQETQKGLKNLVIECDYCDVSAQADDVVNALHYYWISASRPVDDFFDTAMVNNLKKWCPSLTSERLAQIILPIKQRKKMNPNIEAEEDNRVRIGASPTNWRTTTSF